MGGILTMGFMMFYIDTEEWLEGRSHGIGGSEAGIVLGLNPWKSRLELWHEKVNKTRHLDPETKISIKLGNFLEPLIAEEYSKMTERKLEMKPQKVHPKYPFILGNIDREIIDDSDKGSGPGILEIKTKGAFTNWYGEDIPIYYIAQIQQYLEIYGYDWGSFAVLDLGTLKISCIDIERDNDMINNIIDEEIKFWNLVENNISPGIDDSESCHKFLRKYYNQSKTITIDLVENEDALKWVRQLKDVRDQIKILEVKEIEAKNHLMQIMGVAEKGVGNDYSINWKAPKDKEVFDLNRFKIDHPRMVEKYLRTESQTRRFTVRFGSTF